MKKVITMLLTLVLVIMPFTVLAKSSKKTTVTKDPANIYLFRGEGCPHCEEFLTWWESVDETEKNKVNLIQYEVWYDTSNAKLMSKVSDYFGDDASGVPYIIIGETTFPDGFSESMGDEVLAAIDKLYEQDERFDVMNYIDTSTLDEEETTTKETSKTTIAIVVVLIVVGAAGLIFVMSKSEL